MRFAPSPAEILHDFRADENLLVDARGVCMNFKMPTERIDNLKEYAIKFLKRKIKYKKFEVLKDVQSSLAPVSKDEALDMIHRLRGYKIIKGVRGQEPVNEELFAETVSRVSALVQAAPEIAEMDLNPLLGTSTAVVAVDARIRVEK